MMRRQLDDVRGWGEPLAALTASEPEIYGRFGYGVAAEKLTARVDTEGVRIRVPADADGLRLRLVGPREPEVLRRCEELYARRVPVRAGMLERRPGWQATAVHDPQRSRDGASPMQCVLAERDGELRGYARYAVRAQSDAAPGGEVLLRNMAAADAEAHAVLLRYLSDIDLTRTLRIDDMPVGRPAGAPGLQRPQVRVRRPGLAATCGSWTCAPRWRPGRTRPRWTWCWRSRTPSAPGTRGAGGCPADAEGASCARTRDPADLALSVADLGAVYLGGTSLAALAAAGLVTELRPGALAAASVAFRGGLAPWLPHGF